MPVALSNGKGADGDAGSIEAATTPPKIRMPIHILGISPCIYCTTEESTNALSLKTGHGATICIRSDDSGLYCDAVDGDVHSVSAPILHRASEAMEGPRPALHKWNARRAV